MRRLVISMAMLAGISASAIVVGQGFEEHQRIDVYALDLFVVAIGVDNDSRKRYASAPHTGQR